MIRQLERYSTSLSGIMKLRFLLRRNRGFMPHRHVAAVAFIALIALLVSACRSTAPPPSELEGAQTASDAYLAYERGDCVTARRLSDPEVLESWPFNEMRHSVLLIQGFCREIDGDVDGAREIYRRLVLDAPTSFASDDAAERTRILKLIEDDPGYSSRVLEVKEGANPDRPRRTPIDRVPAQFPPLAKATGVEGYVVIDFDVTQRGTTEDPLVVDSHPPFLFDGAALRAVRQWQYMREGSADGDSRQLIRIVFRPETEDDSADEGMETMSGAVDPPTDSRPDPQFDAQPDAP